MTGLNCYCDHCPNNTCTAQEGGLCYAEWAPVTTTTTSTTTRNLNNNNHYLHDTIINNHHNNEDHVQGIILEKKFNCFNKDSTLFQSMVCNETVSNTSNVIRKCCTSGNYCNSKEDLLPPKKEAYKLFESYLPQRGSSLLLDRNHSSSLFSEFFQYSNLPLGIALILSLILLTMTAIALRRRFGFPGFLRAWQNQNSEEDCSENSSGKANSDAAVFDTNSMASREPLLNPLFKHHRGPFMTTEETYTGKPPSTFQMTLGSEQHKQETSSGSGAGQPYLTQRSIAHDIELVEVVGRGFFGVVWRGEYKGEPVAVKIFSPMAEPSWEREAEIYQTTMLRHKNILGFIATDKRHDAAMTGYWLVTDFYPMGSLYDFLRDNSMSMSDAVRMAFSIANGLSHLHVEIFGTQGKPAIAHRDLKSKNILVKNDGTCCIADLGMAVRFNSSTGIVDVPTNSRVGTRRYLAPEILEGRLNLMDFEAVKLTDIYALGLVLWEVLRRACLVHPSATSNVDPNFSYSMEQQQTTTVTSPTSSRSSNASPQPMGAPVYQPLVTASPTVPPATSTPDYRQQEPPRTSTPQAGAQSTSANIVRTPPTAAHQQFQESLETTLDDTSTDMALLCDPYEAPYSQHVSVDPTAEEMRHVVCRLKVRPQMSLRWTKFASMRDYVALMTECWYEKPQARLSALRVRKSLGELARKYFNMNMEYD